MKKAERKKFKDELDKDLSSEIVNTDSQPKNYIANLSKADAEGGITIFQAPKFVSTHTHEINNTDTYNTPITRTNFLSNGSLVVPKRDNSLATREVNVKSFVESTVKTKKVKRTSKKRIGSTFLNIVASVIVVSVIAALVLVTLFLI